MTRAKKLRLAIFGAGAMATEHAGSWGAIEDAEIAAIFSRRHDPAEKLARTCGARPYTDAAALIGDSRIDAIDVCVPSANHPEYVIAALSAGKHVFCETPFALTLADVDAMIGAARGAGRTVQVGLVMRSIADYEYIHSLTASGEYGRLLSVTAYRLGSYLRVDSPDHKEHYSEPSLELMTFDFDFIQWVMGLPDGITAAAAAGDLPGEITAVLHFNDGRSATVLASGIMPVSFPFSPGFRALFEDGAFEQRTVFGDGPPKSTMRFYPNRGSPRDVRIPSHDPIEKELRHFVGCIRGTADPALLAPERAREALLLSLATQRAIKTRAPSPAAWLAGEK